MGTLGRMAQTEAPHQRPAGEQHSVSLALSQIVVLLAGLAAVCTLAGVMIAALFLPAVALTSTAAKDGAELFDSLPSQLEVQPLNEASHIKASDGTLLATFYSENRIMVPLEEVSPHLQHAVIAVEDRRFYEHQGVDAKGTLRALASNARGGDTQGASTLTQQYVKNALLADAMQRGDKEAMKKATEQSYSRKLREAKLAISVEKRLSKEEILAGYLNAAQFGPSQYGVETAAQHYFSKSAKDLNPGESALLAGVTNAPNYYDPVAHPKNAKKRRNEILRKMRAEDYISDAELKKYSEQPVKDMLKVKNITAGCADAEGSGFFCDYVTKSLLSDPAFAPTFEERRKLLYGGGLTITTTLDPKRQKIAEDVVNRRVPAEHSNGFGHTVVSVEPGTGKILTMAQNRVYNPRQDAKENETSLNFNAPKHMGGGSGFPVGSTFKPFVLTTYLQQGGSIWDTVATNREVFREFPAKCLGSGRWFEGAGWNPDNAVSVTLPPNQTVLDATKFSVNTSYARIAHRSDLCEIADTARSMGAVPAYWDTSKKENLNVPVEDMYKTDLSPAVLALGELNISALDMAAAYATYPAGGKFCRPVAITSVTNRKGEELPITGGECKDVIKPEVADAMSWTLMQDLSDPKATGKGMTIPGHDAGGKTGTSGSQFHTWYVGFTGQESTAVWFGNPTSNTRPGGFNVDGQPLRRGHVWGNTVSLPTWHEYMKRSHEGLPNKPFPPEPPKPDAAEKKQDAQERAAQEKQVEQESGGKKPTGPDAAEGDTTAPGQEGD
ncbi:transglycosylase domain-containing protein [Helcobacillus massiliensis]